MAMHQITTQQRKQQILTRVAQTRVQVLDSAVRAQSGAGVCLDVMHISRQTARYGALAIAGYAGLKFARLIFKMMWGRKPAPIQKVVPASAPVQPALTAPKGGLLKYVIAQLFTIVLLPWLKDWALGVSMPKKVDYWRPSRIFFRWLGLEK